MLHEHWNRQELYDKVWASPVVKVAKEYGVSDVAIAKVCRKLKVPVPGRGYWAKKAHGHAVTKQPLPKLKEKIVVERIGPTVKTTIDSPVPKLHPDDRAEFSRIDTLMSQGAFAFKATPKALRHPLIIETRKGLLDGYTDDRKIVRPSFSSGALNVRVAKESIPRTLEFVASMVCCAEEHEAELRVTQRDRDRQTFFEALGQSISVSISEPAKQHYLEAPPPQPKGRYVRVLTFGGKPIEYIPTGKLTIEIGGYGDGVQRHWKEGKQTLQDFFPEFMASLFKAAILSRRQGLDRQAEEEARQRREAELQVLRRRIGEEERRVERLCQEAENWEKAKAIRRYVIEVMDYKKQQGEDLGPDTPLGIWVTWALQQADRLDPLAKSPSSILDRKKELPPAPTDPWRFR